MAGRLNQVQNEDAWLRVQNGAKARAAEAVVTGGRREQLTHLERGYYDALQRRK
jgi:hypothetical protein